MQSSQAFEPVTQVGIIGAGPAGLVLARLLHRNGIACVVLESQSREYVERRVRAGVLECGTVDLLHELGVGERLEREGLRHEGTDLRFAGEDHRIDFAALTGKTVTVYGQQEVVKDLIAANLADGIPIVFEAPVERLAGLTGGQAALEYRDADGVAHELRCTFVAGCDGFHGVSRRAIPDGSIATMTRSYPFAWYGVLAESTPVSEELIYVNHERGFALLSMRSPTVTRLYLQVPGDADENVYDDDSFWDELERRLETHAGGPKLERGRIFQKSVAVLRAFVTEPMRYGRLFLAGDSAHIVPPTGAKGMNMAIGDVRVLAAALERYFARGDESGLEAYSSDCLRRVWNVQRFSNYMTSMLHRFPDHGAFERALQLAELRRVVNSPAAAQALAENYVGLALA